MKKDKCKTKPGLTLIMGKPGSGKSTMMSLLVRKAIKKDIPVYCTHHVLGAIKVDAKDLGKYMLEDCIIIVDEAQLQYDSRDFKNFPECNKFFFSHYRHFKCEVYILSQSYEDLDVKIRRQAQRLYLMQPFLFSSIIFLQKVRMKFGISEDETSIITKYKTSLFDIRFKWGRVGWKFFDSYSKPDLPQMEKEYWGSSPVEKKSLKQLLKKLFSLINKKKECSAPL